MVLEKKLEILGIIGGGSLLFEIYIRWSYICQMVKY